MATDFDNEALTTIDQEFVVTLNGKEVMARSGDTILDVAERCGEEIPRLCFSDFLRPDGNCRACVVEIKGERVLSPSCCRAALPGMNIVSNSERVLKNQNLIIEMLLADLPEFGQKWINDHPDLPHGELSHWSMIRNVEPRAEFKRDATFDELVIDRTHPAINVNLNSCIQCNRCVRACRETQHNNVIGMVNRGSSVKVAFDLNDSLGMSTCVGCGECVQACPTGALMSKSLVGSQSMDREVDSVCPYCGVGCQLTYKVRNERIVGVEGRNGPANAERLCVKGRYGFDYVHHPDRLTSPLVRKTGIPKDPSFLQRKVHWSELFEEVSWEEALKRAVDSFRKIKAQHSGRSLAGFGSAKGTNEEAYLFQKLIRTGFETNNVDHCTRLCHSSSVAALLEGLGSGAVSNPIRDVAESDFIFVIGSNPTANHPVGATWMKQAVASGARLVVADPRLTDISEYSWRTLQFKPDTDLALLNAILNVIVTEGLVDEHFVQNRVEGYEEFAQNILRYTPEAMSPICGVSADLIREVAIAYATSKSSIIFWGMGVSQHVHGTDNVRCLIAMASVTGQIGRPGTGLHPLRGQNNVQGASDAGLIPMMFPNYKPVDDPLNREKFERLWSKHLPVEKGLTVVEIMDAALKDNLDQGKVRGIYIMGENPAMSDPDLNHAREALANLELLVVQDIFLTETAMLADIVLPASAWPEKTGSVSNTDRMVQIGQKAIEPPGLAKPDLWIIQQIASGLGLDWSYTQGEYGVADIYEEMRHAMSDSIGGITWDRLNQSGSVTYPCLSESDPGQPVLFKDTFPTMSGKVSLKAVTLSYAAEVPDEDFPLVLITGRQLEHWHTGSMTRRSFTLDSIEPEATISICQSDVVRLGLVDDEYAVVASRRGSVKVKVRVDDGCPVGSVFMPFAYYESAANLLTNPTLDPDGKIPEFKYCAVKVDPILVA